MQSVSESASHLQLQADVIAHNLLFHLSTKERVFSYAYPSSLLPTNMANLKAREHISPDSGFPMTLHPNFNPNIRDNVPHLKPRELVSPPKDRAHSADPEKKALFSVAKRVDLTESIGTVLEDVQLSQLNGAQLDELALLVSERGVVFFRDQDLTTEQQIDLFAHYGE